MCRQILSFGMIGTLIGSGLLISNVGSAQAQNATVGGVALSPALIERDVNPGETIELNVKASNLTGDRKPFYLSSADFVGDPEEGGRPYFVQQTDTTSFSKWVALTATTVTLGGGERKEIPFTVTVPADAEPGTRFGAIIISENEPNLVGGTQVAVTTSVATLLFMKVSGKVVEEGEAIEFKTSRPWYATPPVTFEVRFENTGNVHTKPTGLIEVFNSAGVKEEVIQINQGFGSVLPASTRKFEEVWNPPKWLNVIPRIGRYKAEGIVTYGSPSTTQKLSDITFWLIPWKFLGAILGSILLLIIGLRLLLRLYAKAVIRQHAKRR